jgi:hypothetical protein
MAFARTNQGGKATGSCSSIEEDGDGREEEDSKPSPVTSNARIGSSICDSVEDDGGGRDEDEEDSKPSLVTSSSALTGLDPEQEVVQEEATPDSNPSLVTSNAQIGSDPEQEVIPLGWRRAKLEPDC